MTLAIHHYFPLGSDNVGDHLVAHAIQQRVRRHLGPAKFTTFPANDRYRANDRTIGLLGDNLRRSQAEADLIIVGGSNMLEPRKLSRSGEGWQWGVFTDVESIRQLDKPLLLVGMGTGSGIAKPIRPYPQRARDEISALHGQALASAVRDVTTQRALAEIGVTTDCTGCPVTFLTDREVTAADERLPLLVSFPPSRMVRRWSGRRFMRGAMHYVDQLRRRGVPLIVTLHETRDLEIIRQWLPSGVETFYTEDLSELIARYEACRGVIGFRLHAALLALGLGKPIVPVGVDWRGLAFVETFGLEAWTADPRQWRPFARLRAATEQLLDGDDVYVGTLARAKRQWLARYDTFWSNVTERFTRRGRSTQTAGPAAAPSHDLRRVG